LVFLSDISGILPIESVNLLHLFHFFNKILHEGIFCDRVAVTITRVTFFP